MFENLKIKIFYQFKKFSISDKFSIFWKIFCFKLKLDKRKKKFWNWSKENENEINTVKNGKNKIFSENRKKKFLVY